MLLHLSIPDDIYYCTMNRLMRITQGLPFCISFALMDIIPIMAYYHSYKIIQSIEILEIEISMEISQTHNHINLSDHLDLLSLRFERIRSPVLHADYLFGCFVILGQGVCFFDMFSSVYSLLSCIRSCPQYSGAVLALIDHPFQLIS